VTFQRLFAGSVNGWSCLPRSSKIGEFPFFESFSKQNELSSKYFPIDWFDSAQTELSFQFSGYEDISNKISRFGIIE
jgi:hypothetical protein